MGCPYVSRYPSGRARWDSDVLPDILAWLSVLRESYARAARQGTRGATPEERARRKARARAARNAVSVIDRICRSVCTSCDHARFARYRQEIVARATELSRG